MSYKAYFEFSSNEEPKTNALVFESNEQTNAYARDLMTRWMMPTGFQIRESEETPNYVFIDNNLTRINNGA